MTSKTFSTFLKENAKSVSINESQEGTSEGFIGPADLAYLNKFSKQVNGAVQPTIQDTITKIEKELNKFGYSLGETEFEFESDESGTEEFVLVQYSTQELIRNVFLTIDYRRVSTKIYDFAPKKLEYAFDIKFVEITPEDFDAKFISQIEDLDAIAVSEQKEEVLEESDKMRQFDIDFAHKVSGNKDRLSHHLHGVDSDTLKAIRDEFYKDEKKKKMFDLATKGMAPIK